MEKIIYEDWALRKGNLIALGGNLWNQHVSAAIRHKKAGEDDLQAAAGAFFEKILPEMQNFMEQKLAKSDLRIEELQKAVDGIAPFCKVKYGMDEEAVAAIDRLAGQGTAR